MWRTVETGSNSRLWTSDFTLALVSRSFTSIVFQFLNATIAAYALAVLGVSVGLAGVAAGVFILSAVASRIFAGKYLDIIGRRRLVLLSGSALALTSCAYLLPMGIGGLIVVRCLHGIAHGVSSNTLTTVVTDYIPRDRMGEGLGYLNLNTTIAAALGPFAGILLLQNGLYTEMFALCAVLTVTGFVLMFFLRVREMTPEEMRENEVDSRGLRAYFEPKALPLSVVVLVLCVCSSCVTAFLSPYADQVGAGWCAPWFFVAYAALMAVARLALGKVMDRRGDNALVYPLFAVFVAGLLALSLAPVAPAPALFAAAFALALGYGGLFPACQAIAVRDVPARRMGVATSTFFVFTDAGMGLGPMFGGAIIPLVGYTGNYAACAGVAMCCAVLYWLLHGRRPAARKPAGTD